MREYEQSYYIDDNGNKHITYANTYAPVTIHLVLQVFSYLKLLKYL